ncbi:hypothetical protein [Limimaricola litoreus]|nr:hypothetical protein [Limimaricola litoreus]
MRGARADSFCALRHGRGIEEVLAHLRRMGGLAAPALAPRVAAG